MDKIKEVEIVKAFIGLCIPSISPDKMDKLEEILEQLIKNRHLPTTKEQLLENKKRENCCVISCNKKAKYQIGDKGKPSSESTFICEEHKGTIAYDWIEDYKC